MNTSPITFAAGLVIAMAAARTAAADDHSDISAEAVRDAIVRSLTLVEKSTAEYRQQRTCFSCHHQALPILMLAKARQHGFDIDEENFQAQLQWTHQHLTRGKENYRQGKGQGGSADTAGYALWALEAGGWKADETTDAVASYLLQRDESRDHWRSSSTTRPPSEASNFTTTAIALRGLGGFGTSAQTQQIAARRETVVQWLSNTEPQDTEDRVFRLHGLDYLDAKPSEINTAVDELRETRRNDGGWAQTEKLSSDAYATGSVLVALHDAGGMPADDPVYQQAVKFLLATQLADGSWHVATRSKPFQTYFESGFPHGDDQFISMSATCWATMALILTCPRTADAAAE